MGTSLCREPCKGESVSDQKEPSRGRQVFLKVLCPLQPADVWDARADLVEPIKENHHVVKRFRFHSTFEARGACGHNYLATNASDIRQQEHEPD